MSLYLDKEDVSSRLSQNKVKREWVVNEKQLYVVCDVDVLLLYELLV
jgi:hypothetical protein